MGIGAGAGLAIAGYYEGKKARNESEEKDAQMKIQKLEDQIRVLQQSGKIQGVQDADLKAKQEREIRDAKQPGLKHGAEGELGRSQRKQAGELRTEGIAVKKQPGLEHDAEGELGRSQRKQAGELRTEGIAVKKQPGLEYGAEGELVRQQQKRTREEQGAGQETGMVKARELYNSLTEAIASYEASGNPAAFDDWYRISMPNGHEVTTTADPDNPGGFITTDSNGKVGKIANKEELLATMIGVRDRIEEQIRAPGNLGPSAGQRGPDYSLGSGRGGIGYSGSGGNRTQLERMLPQMIDDLTQMYPELEPYERRIMAINKLKERGGEPLHVVIQKWDAQMMEIRAGMGDRAGKQEKFMKLYWEMREMMFGPMYGKPKPVGKDGKPKLTDDEARDNIFNGND